MTGPAGHWWAWLGWKMGGGGSGLGREQGAWLGPRRRVSHAYGGDGKELRAWLASRVGWEVGQDGWGLGGHCWTWLGSWLGVLGEDSRASQGLAGIASAVGSWEVGQAGGRRGESLAGIGWSGMVVAGEGDYGPFSPLCLPPPFSPPSTGYCGNPLGRTDGGSQVPRRVMRAARSPCGLSSFITLPL